MPAATSVRVTACVVALPALADHTYVYPAPAVAVKVMEAPVGIFELNGVIATVGSARTFNVTAGVYTRADAGAFASRTPRL